MTTGWDVAYYILLPLAWIFELLIYILGIVAAPILFAIRILLHVLSLPLRILAKFEVGISTVNPESSHIIRRWAITLG
jgi:uncharacterized protein YybS (DUF2232 family)